MVTLLHRFLAAFSGSLCKSGLHSADAPGAPESWLFFTYHSFMSLGCSWIAVAWFGRRTPASVGSVATFIPRILFADCLRILPRFAGFCRAILLKLFRFRCLFRTLDQHIGVRIPGGQPINTRGFLNAPSSTLFCVTTVSPFGDRFSWPIHAERTITIF